MPVGYSASPVVVTAPFDSPFLLRAVIGSSVFSLSNEASSPLLFDRLLDVATSGWLAVASSMSFAASCSSPIPSSV